MRRFLRKKSIRRLLYPCRPAWLPSVSHQSGTSLNFEISSWFTEGLFGLVSLEQKFRSLGTPGSDFSPKKNLACRKVGIFGSIIKNFLNFISEIKFLRTFYKKILIFRKWLLFPTAAIPILESSTSLPNFS